MARASPMTCRQVAIRSLLMANPVPVPSRVLPRPPWLTVNNDLRASTVRSRTDLAAGDLAGSFWEKTGVQSEKARIMMSRSIMEIGSFELGVMLVLKTELASVIYS